MELLKRSLVALVLLLIVCAIWVGLSIYYDTTSLDVNPNASSYTKQLRGEFDLEELSKITERTAESFPVQPDEFFSLVGEN
jgi:hypothetical protein